jgi:N-acetylglucosaminyl-diphospho-decaprenol L-rhamnosyltransferase
MTADVGSVTALVVTWDSARDIERCLASLEASSMTLDIVVLDNASSDDTVARVEAFLPRGAPPPLTLVRLPQNRGFCGAVNLGIRSSTADAVLLVNPDATVGPDALGG